LPNGKVLIAGGGGAAGTLASAELYDPSYGTFTATGSMTVARWGHTATLLLSGKVLIAEGASSNSYPYLASAELYDPAAGRFTATDNMTGVARVFHTATLLPSGKVLIAGGDDGINYLASAGLYDPGAGRFTATGNLIAARDNHTATLLPNGKVLIAGGSDFSGILASAELYE
jgi:hypothetical protein